MYCHTHTHKQRLVSRISELHTNTLIIVSVIVRHIVIVWSRRTILADAASVSLHVVHHNLSDFIKVTCMIHNAQ